MIKHINRIGLGLLLYAAVVYLYSAAKQKQPPSPGPQPFDPTAFRAVDWFPGHGLTAEEKQAYLQGIDRRVRRLAEMEFEREKRERATRLTRAAREEAQGQAAGAWALVVKTNMAKFHQLREVAQKEPKGVTSCTICDGFSYMPCVMCEGRDGRCISCRGTGRRVGIEYCPACVGNGQCYLCTGSGKMLCPFCDDGTIDIKWPLPEAAPPLE